MRFVPLLVLTLGGVAACSASSDGGAVPSPHADVTTSGSSVSIVSEEEANLVLIASNQSFEDESVRLRIRVDDVTVVDDDFVVGDQHNYAYFNLRLPAGRHRVLATSDSGARLEQQLVIPRDEVRYAVLDHWTGDESSETTETPTYFGWTVAAEPPGFA